MKNTIPNKEITLTIVTITKNDPVGMMKTKTSILAQNDSTFEWLIVNGGEKIMFDQTISSICSIRLIQEPDEGIYDAMNKGAHHARGLYLLYLNSGDRLADVDTVLQIKDHLKQTSADIVYGNSIEELPNSSLAFRKASSVSRIWECLFARHQAIIYSRACILKEKYDPSYKYCGDYELTARLLGKGVTTQFLDIPLCIFNRTGISQSHFVRARAETLRFRKKHLAQSWIFARLIVAKLILQGSVNYYCPKLYERLLRLTGRWKEVA